MKISVVDSQSIIILTPQFRQGLFEQVYAAEDFTVFTRMMTQKNIELQLQALELLRAK